MSILQKAANTMRNGNIILTLVLAAIVAWATVYFTTPKMATPIAKKETAYERVIRTKTLRCGYVVYPPMLKKDANTGQLSGIGYDIVMKMAEMMKLKVEWTTESNWPTYPSDLENGKFDAMCTLDFFYPVLIGHIEATQPLFLTTMGVYKKKGNDRFATGFRDFNDPTVKLSALDGSIAMLLRNEAYPKAQLLSMPATSDYSTILENIADGKADLTFVERAVANSYIKANPNKIEDITGPAPFVVYPYILPVAKGEQNLISMFDQAATILHLNGFIEKTLDQHAPGDYVPVDIYKNYKMSK